jgi:hypothetical protein
VKLNRVKKVMPPAVRGADEGRIDHERFVWEVLVPRLLHPSKLTFIQALLKQGAPLSLSQLAKAADLTIEHARYQCASMQRAGVIEVAQVVPRADGEGDEPCFYFLDRAGSSPTEDHHRRLRAGESLDRHSPSSHIKGEG